MTPLSTNALRTPSLAFSQVRATCVPFLAEPIRLKIRDVRRRLLLSSRTGPRTSVVDGQAAGGLVSLLAAVA